MNISVRGKKEEFGGENLPTRYAVLYEKRKEFERIDIHPPPCPTEFVMCFSLEMHGNMSGGAWGVIRGPHST